MSDNAHTRHAGPHTRGHVIHWARAYDLLTSLVGAGPRSTARKETIRHADLQPGESVLDVGCGPGVLTLLAAARVGAAGQAHGIDPSPQMVKLAQGKSAKAAVPATFREGVVEALPYADATFDAVLSSLMLHHLPEDVRRTGFAEIARVLKPGGRLLAFDLSGKGSIMGRLMSLAGHKLPDTYGRDLAAMLNESGFSAQIIPSQPRYVTILARKPG
jgi:demethylmenaquinone methyltransferase/2-methoxy-6-polyprenyl-1,4-benzoquinol methylase/phosphoethanolamine N-methyltransferase